MIRRLLVIGGAAVLLVSAAAGRAAEGPHWSYEGAGGPASWGDLATEYAICKTGRMQSPIDLGSANAHGKVAIALDYRPAPLTVLNNGHTVQFNVGNGSKLSAAGLDYELQQVHFHAPSEHTVAGKSYPLEAHFVHKARDGSLAVVGVFLEEGRDNPALAALLKHLPETKAEPATYKDTEINAADLLPKSTGLYRYMGSLTTPPCSEGVAWHVLQQPITASKAQIERLARVLGKNARPVQSPFGRLIVAPGG